jgi:hypothetical protein
MRKIAGTGNSSPTQRLRREQMNPSRNAQTKKMNFTSRHRRLIELATMARTSL